MRIVVAIRSVPDLVEEIDIASDGKSIDAEYLKFITSEWDAQALEEALLIKDSAQAEVVAVGLADDPEIDEVLYGALAKGADSALKLVGGGTSDAAPGAGARRPGILAAYLATAHADLVLSGVQAPDDSGGQLVPALGFLLGWPHVSVVVSVEAAGPVVSVRQELGAGRYHDLEVPTPAVLGIQSARQAPRYAPISRIRQAMQAGPIAELTFDPRPAGPQADLRSLRRPDVTATAEMLAGGPAEVAGQIVALLGARGLLKGE